MSSEYQRIVTELCNLQQQIFRNQLPSLLIKFNQQEDVPFAIQQFVTGLIQVCKSQFILTLAQNIENAKQENNKLKIQNQELRKSMKNQQIQVNSIRQGIQELVKEKNCLNCQLQGLKDQQKSLGELINSSSVESRIKEILKENQYLKIQLKQRDQLIDIKNGQIKQFRQKQGFYNSQIKALTNDNILFHRDLIQANLKIKKLTEQVNLLNEKEQSSKMSIVTANECFKKQMNQLRLSHSKQRHSLQQTQILLQRKNQECQLLTEMMEKEKQRHCHVQEQVIYLRNSFQNVNSQIIDLTEQKREAEYKLMQARQQNINLNQVIQKTIKKYSLQISQLQAKLGQQKNQQLSVKSLVTEQKKIHQQKYQKLQQQFQQYRNVSNSQKIEQQNIHLSALFEVRKQAQKIRQSLEDMEKENECLKTQLKVEKQKGEEYTIYLQQNNQLRAELQRMITFKRSQNNSNRLTAFNKFLFQVMEISEVVNKLKHQNIQLRALVFRTIETTRKWMNKEINKFICFVMEKKAECQTCNHWQKYEANKKLINQSSSKGKQIKTGRDLQLLNEKFKLIREQNEIFSHRIQQIIED